MQNPSFETSWEPLMRVITISLWPCISHCPQRGREPDLNWVLDQSPKKNTVQRRGCVFLSSKKTYFFKLVSASVLVFLVRWNKTRRNHRAVIDTLASKVQCSLSRLTIWFYFAEKQNVKYRLICIFFLTMEFMSPELIKDFQLTPPVMSGLFMLLHRNQWRNETFGGGHQHVFINNNEINT